MITRNSLLILPAILALTACSSITGIEGEAKYPTGEDRGAAGGNNIYEEAPSIFGSKDGGGLFGNSRAANAESSVAVNGYLWRAALDTVSFMPLASADPFGGTIITEWYAAPETQNERTKLNVFILGREMKAESLSVKVFRQVKSGGGWKDTAVAKDTATKMEDAILTRAREMRMAKEE